MTLALLWTSLLGAVALYMSVWFVAARLVNRIDLVDSAWGLGFAYVAWLAWALEGHRSGRALLAALFVNLWGIRLFIHIFRRNRNRHEDYRYARYRAKWGPHFWWQAYLRIFLLQGLLLLLISTAAIGTMTARGMGWRWLSVLGFVVWLTGIVFETVADAQLANFAKTKQPGQIMQRGLWKYSRHPNYFGEITTWWGAALVAISVEAWWGIAGALLITLLITKVSGIPPLERHYAANPQFQSYKQRTSVLLPLPPRHPDS